jgi:hypothetical protein
MRASLGLRAVLVSAAVAAALACTANSPLMNGSQPSTVNQMTGTAGKTGAAGASSGAAGATATGQASGDAGATGEAGLSGILGVAARSGAAGQAGASGAAGAPPPPITMCGVQATRADGTCVAGAYKRMGVCTCQPTATCICASGCTDQLSDDDNCGACGVRCGPTSTCQQGVCGPPVTNFVPAAPGCGSIDLAVANGLLYWTDAGHFTVKSRPLSGGAATAIADAEKGPKMITVVGSNIFWVSTDQNIRKSVGGGPPTTVVSTPSPIGGFTVSPDGSTVYFSTGSAVSRVSAAGGGTPVVVAVEERGGIPRALALTGNQIAYPTDLNGDVDVATIVTGQVADCGNQDSMGNIVNFNCNRLARSQGELFPEQIIALPGARVVWADGSNVKLETTPSDWNTIAPFDSVAMTWSNSISGLASNGMLVFFGERSADDGSGGVVYMAAIAPNQNALRIARGQHGPRALATGPSRVYWSTSDCTIESQGL